MLSLLWDMNGVLVDDEPVQERAWTEALAAAGLVLEDGWWQRHFLGRKASVTVASLFPQLAVQARDALLADKQQRYKIASARGLPVVPGAKAMLEAAHARGIRQALVTGASPAEMSLVLDQLQAHALFDVLVCGADIKVGKPAPDGFLLGARRLGADPRDCWVIEDALSGVQAAHAAGMRVVALTTSFPAEMLRAADLVVSALGENLLERL